MKCLELFSGNGDITKALKDAGYKVCSVDWDERTNAMYHWDIYNIGKDWYKQFSFIWLSPDCTTYSMASHGKHRIKGHIPVSDYAKECDEKNEKLFKMLIELDIPFIAENPRCHFRHMNWVKDLYRTTVYYSTYGEVYAKPTDLFSNRKELLDVFDTRYIRGTIQMDWVKQPSDFLGRCKMPSRLVDDIVKAVKIVG